MAPQVMLIADAAMVCVPSEATKAATLPTPPASLHDPAGWPAQATRQARRALDIARDRVDQTACEQLAWRKDDFQEPAAAHRPRPPGSVGYELA